MEISGIGSWGLGGTGKWREKQVWGVGLLWLNLTCKTCEIPPDGGRFLKTPLPAQARSQETECRGRASPTGATWICCIGHPRWKFWSVGLSLKPQPSPLPGTAAVNKLGGDGSAGLRGPHSPHLGLCRPTQAAGWKQAGPSSPAVSAHLLPAENLSHGISLLAPEEV